MSSATNLSQSVFHVVLWVPHPDSPVLVTTNNYVGGAMDGLACSG